jgi:colanic acid/amylovoran biosynthesis glycosyltransferase
LLRDDDKLRIAYAGRVHKEKGVYDWIDVLTQLSEKSVDFSALWFGDGPELDNVRRLVTAKGLSSKISFPGSLDHLEIIRELQSFDIFVFCHKTRESPRCLIEALLCGLPLIGYSTDFAKELISENFGGLLTPVNIVSDVSDSIATISDRSKLRALSERAFKDGRRFNIVDVFVHRARLTKNLSNRNPSANESDH